MTTDRERLIGELRAFRPTCLTDMRNVAGLIHRAAAMLEADAPTADDQALSEAFGRAGTADTFIPLASPTAEDYANAERIADEARAIFCGSPTLPPRQRIVVEKIAAALAAARRSKEIQR